MLVIVLAACACGSTLLWGALVLRGRRRSARGSSAASMSEAARLLRSVGAEVLDVHGAATRTPEEDRVRAAVDPSGAPTWVYVEDLFWHEIVCWPPRRDAPDAGEQARKSTVQGR